MTHRIMSQKPISTESTSDAATPNIIENLNLLRAVAELTGVELIADDIAYMRHDLITVLLIAAHCKKGELTDNQANRLSLLFSQLLKLQLRAHSGDSEARLFLEAISKCTDPPQNPPSSVKKKKAFIPAVKDFMSNGASSEHLVRACKIRSLMSQLSFSVEPTEYAKLTPQTTIKMRETPLLNGDLYIEAKKIIEGSFNRKRTPLTLETLARKIYLNKLSKTNKKSETEGREIRRSLAEFRKYEQAYPDEIERSPKLPVLGGDPLPCPILS